MVGNIEAYYETVEIERKTVIDGTWGPETTWATHIVVQGRMRQLNGNERFTSGKDTTFSTHRLYCDPADILPTDRISYDGRKYDIHAVNDVMNFDRLMQVDCELIDT